MEVTLTRNDRRRSDGTLLVLCVDRHRISSADFEISWHRRWGTLIQPVEDTVSGLVQIKGALVYPNDSVAHVLSTT
jgi:hypothetical protein